MDDIKNGKYPYSNFGNTAEGICQCLPGSSIGDRHQKKDNRNIMLTNTMVEFHKNQNIELIGSDGFFDMMTDESIISILSDLIDSSSKSDLRTIKDKLVKKMFEESKKYNFSKNWDDITFCLINTNPLNNKKVNKFKKKRQSQRKRRRLNKYNKTH